MTAASSPAPTPPPLGTATPREDGDDHKPLNFSLPLAIGDQATGVRIPQYGLAGQLLSLLNSTSIKRLDENRLELKGTTLDLNKPDGKTDFHIHLPTSVFDTRTRLLTSEQPVSISTEDFNLQGERMEFDTGARQGRFSGWVYMKIHNAKGMASSAAGGRSGNPPREEGSPPAASPPQKP